MSPSPAKSTTGQHGILRACFNARIPEFGAMIRSAAEMRSIPMWVSELQLPADWDLLYFHTPTRIRVGSVEAPWLTAAANTAVLIRPYTHFWVDTRANHGQGHHTWMNVERLDDLPVSHLPAGPQGLPYIRDPEGRLGQAMTRLVDVTVELGERAFWALQLIGHRILDQVAGAVPVGDGSLTLQGRKPLVVDPLVARVLGYLSANLGGKLTLEGIARQLNTSPSTISHHYREATGETALATHRRMRLLEVKRLLARGQPLAAIAAQVGYCDIHHLSREFKRQEDLTPRAFVAQFLPRELV